MRATSLWQGRLGDAREFRSFLINHYLLAISCHLHEYLHTNMKIIFTSLFTESLHSVHGTYLDIWNNFMVN